MKLLELLVPGSREQTTATRPRGKPVSASFVKLAVKESVNILLVSGGE